MERSVLPVWRPLNGKAIRTEGPTCDTIMLEIMFGNGRVSRANRITFVVTVFTRFLPIKFTITREETDSLLYRPSSNTPPNIRFAIMRHFGPFHRDARRVFFCHFFDNLYLPGIIDI